MSFQHPELLLLLLAIPLLALGAVLTFRTRQRAWRKMVAARLEPLLVRESSKARLWISFGSALLALSLLVVSLAGPIAGYEESPETIRGRNLLIAIDVSRSMLATDLSPSRLSVARASALELLERFPNDRIGLIAFSGVAWLQAPLTIDHQALRESLQQLDYEGFDEDWMPRGGSDIAKAVKLAIDTFKPTGHRDNALVILSDGETHGGSIESAAEDAREAGLTIFTAGFGTDDGGMIPDPSNPRDGKFHDRDGHVVLTRLDRATLSHLARRTGGFYTSGSGQAFSGALARAAERLDQFEEAGLKRRVAIPRFQWFLLPAILLLFVSTLVNTSWQLLARHAAVLLAGIAAISPRAEAGIIPPTEAGASLARGDYQSAVAQFDGEVADSVGERRSRLQLGAGTAAYRLGNYPRALRSWSGALLSRRPEVQEQAHFGLGNAQFYLGLNGLKPGDGAPQPSDPGVRAAIALWGDAIGHFEGALALNPDNRMARENLELVRKRLQELLDQQAPEETDPEGQDPQGDPEGRPDPQNPQNQGNPPDQPPNQQNQGDPRNPEGDPPPQDPPRGQQPPEQGNSGNEEDPQRAESPQRHEGESPEEFARRILGENADLENRPVPLRIRSPRRPEKDW